MLSVRLWVSLLVMNGVGFSQPAAPPTTLTAAAIAANERGIAHLGADPSRPERAVAAFRAALKAVPTDEKFSQILSRNLAAALEGVAASAGRANKLEHAIVAIREARLLHPRRIHYRVLLASYLVRTKDAGARLEAREELLAALHADPDHRIALVTLASIDYQERRLDDGMERLEHALALRPQDAGVVARLREMRRERDVEAKYESIESSVFLVRYAPALRRERAESVLRICEAAWGDLTSQFAHFPEGRVAVTLYPPADFLAATNLHGWVAGVSDGSIRMSIRSTSRESSIRATLRHELTHHVLRSLSTNIPVWLHEGLAQLAEGRSGVAATRRFRSSPESGPKSSTGASAAGPKDVELDVRILSERDSRRVARYYALALAFTHYLRERHGEPGIQKLLRELRAGRSDSVAIQNAFGSSRSELFAAWRATIPPR